MFDDAFAAALLVPCSLYASAMYYSPLLHRTSTVLHPISSPHTAANVQKSHYIALETIIL